VPVVAPRTRRRRGRFARTTHQSGAAPLACDGSACLVVHAHDQQLVGVALVVDAEWRDGPTSHKSTGSEPGDGAIEFLRSQALDALCDLTAEVGGCGLDFVR
jgi:hypothetical protein